MSEWLLLGELMQAAQRRSSREAAAFAAAILRNARTPAIRAIAAAYLEGARAAFRAHAAALRLPRAVVENLTPPVRRALTDGAVRQGQASLEGVLTIIGGSAEVTRAQIEQRARIAVREAVWSGQDQAGREAATIAKAEFKTWVRSWPRTKERDHHDMLEDVTIPSEDKFTLPGGPNAGAQVDGPRDWLSVDDPAEWMNCGHALRFSQRATGEDLATTRRLGRTVYQPPTP